MGVTRTAFTYLQKLCGRWPPLKTVSCCVFSSREESIDTPVHRIFAGLGTLMLLLNALAMNKHSADYFNSMINFHCLIDRFTPLKDFQFQYQTRSSWPFIHHNIESFLFVFILFYVVFMLFLFRFNCLLHLTF